MKCRGFEVVSKYKDKGIHIPVRKTGRSAGYDIESAEDIELAAGELCLVPTGLKAYMQEDEVLMLYIRSSMAVKQQISLSNSVGVIDADYYDNAENEGHIMVAITNHGKKTVRIEKGMRIAQGIFVKYLTTDADVSNDTDIRQGGFGSTGR